MRMEHNRIINKHPHKSKLCASGAPHGQPTPAPPCTSDWWNTTRWDRADLRDHHTHQIRTQDPEPGPCDGIFSPGGGGRPFGSLGMNPWMRPDGACLGLKST